MRTIDLSGIWQCAIPDMTRPITIPGTLDESGIGHRDVGGKKWHPDTDTSRALYQTEEGIRTRLTRVVTFEGPAEITRRLTEEWGFEPRDIVTRLDGYLKGAGVQTVDGLPVYNVCVRIPGTYGARPDAVRYAAGEG